MSGLTPEMIDAMVSAGLSQEQMATILKAHLAADEAKKVARRSGNAERQRRFKARKNQEQVTNSNADNALPSVTDVTASLSDKERSPTPSKEINSPSSETNVSGVAAGNQGFGENIIVLADPRSDLFGRGLKILTGMTGKPEGQLRGLLGRWLKAANDDAVRVLRCIEDAARDKRAEPVAWIEAALKSKAPAGSREAFLKRGLI